MRLIEYADALSFHGDVADLLAAREVENNLILGILLRGAQGEAKPDWFMARLEGEAGETQLVALMTPPRNLLVSSPGGSAPEGALRLLAEFLCAQRILPPGAVAERALSLAFARAFSAQSGREYAIATDERLYRLDRVEDVPVEGTMRLAAQRDMHYLPYWMKAFTDECFHVHSPLDAESAQWCVDRGTMYILEVEGLPVSMAGSSRQMPHGRAVGPVYTPPYYRGRGYATACVALVSRMILDRGQRILRAVYGPCEPRLQQHLPENRLSAGGGLRRSPVHLTAKPENTATRRKHMEKTCGIGIDTGGTYTDAVVYDFETREILDASKALTTRDDLARGILEALDKLNPALVAKSGYGGAVHHAGHQRLRGGQGRAREAPVHRGGRKDGGLGRRGGRAERARRDLLPGRPDDDGRAHRGSARLGEIPGGEPRLVPRRRRAGRRRAERLLEQRRAGEGGLRRRLRALRHPPSSAGTSCSAT